MTKLKTRVGRLRTPDPVANHYFKLAERLERFCGIKLTLGVADVDWVDNCLGIAILEYYLSESENDKATIAKELNYISEAFAKVAGLVRYRPSKYDVERSVQEDVTYLLNEELKFAHWSKFSEFADELMTYSKAANTALAKLALLKGKRGRKDYYWYDPFIFGMQVAAKKSGISMSVQCRDREKLRTPFLDLVGAYEMCLPREMRSSSRAARAKRIETSLRRLAANETDLITQ